VRKLYHRAIAEPCSFQANINQICYVALLACPHPRPCGILCPQAANWKLQAKYLTHVSRSLLRVLGNMRHLYTIKLLKNQ
jgi:hypothetical protein